MKPFRIGALVAPLFATLMSVGWTTVAAQSTPPGGEQFDAALGAVELMNLVPSGIRETCRPTTPAMDGMIAVTQCQPGADTMIYARFADDASLMAAYDAIASGSGTSPGTGTDCAEGAFEGEYTSADGEVAGRLVCQLGPDGYLALWTESDGLVLGAILAAEGSFAALHERWLAARLDTDPAASPEPSAGTMPVSSSEPVPSEG